jgi:negative regulator of flagellin synthesis FlgM
MVDAVGGVRPPGFEGPKGPQDRRGPAPVPEGGSPDRVELSSAAKLLAKVQSLPDVREDRVEEIREQVAGGTYVTDDRLAKALDALVEDFLSGL